HYTIVSYVQSVSSYLNILIITHFPYTTLFRSSIRISDTLACTTKASQPGTGIWIRLSVPANTRGLNRTIARTRIPARAMTDMDADRKSTRLNSSHVENSYAVFCLKKKN